jgi:hypothetical protein
LVERPLWWFLDKVKAFFFAETQARLTAIEMRLTSLEQQLSGGQGFSHLEKANAEQWAAIEQLLFALWRQPQAPLSQRVPGNGAHSSEVDKVHESSNLR